MKFRHLSLALTVYLISSSVLADNYFQEFNSKYHEKLDGKYAIKNQLLVAVDPSITLSNLIQELKNNGIIIATSEIITTKSANTQIIKLKLKENQSIVSTLKKFHKISNVKWVQPNYIYNIHFDPRETEPNDPLFINQYHHQLMENSKAWDISLGNNVLIAVTDDGFDTHHEDLVSQLDVKKGYNFCDDNTNVTPDNGSSGHGTHVAGIVAAEMNNGKGGAGVAGKATILSIKFYAHSCNWTSELIYKSYQYSVDNGAKIISTSYNVDRFVGDKTFIAALDYVYDHNVLHFNSAGNNKQKNPARQVFEELILVASTNSRDVKSGFSNYGERIQISAPGENILSTVPYNQYDVKSGTSMATPNAAGSAALIWAAHPSWNRDQVAAQLIGTADNIDEKNPNYKGMLGTGRINNYRALTQMIAPVKVMDVTVATESNSTKIAIRFDKLLSPDVVNAKKHWQVISLEDSSIISATMKHRWFIGSKVLELVLPKLNPGKYQLTVKDTLQDPFGQPLDGKGSGTPGGDYVKIFDIV